MLEEGNVIELKEGHTVYLVLPEHFCYANRRGCFGKVAQTEVTIGKEKNGLNTDFLAGKYIVTATSMKGGGTARGPNDVYPNGHHVKCIGAQNNQIQVSFYQSGSFTAMIEGINSIGQAKPNWSEV